MDENEAGVGARGVEGRDEDDEAGPSPPSAELRGEAVGDGVVWAGVPEPKLAAAAPTAWAAWAADAAANCTGTEPEVQQGDGRGRSAWGVAVAEGSKVLRTCLGMQAGKQGRPRQRAHLASRRRPQRLKPLSVSVIPCVSA